MVSPQMLLRWQPSPKEVSAVLSCFCCWFMSDVRMILHTAPENIKVYAPKNHVLVLPVFKGGGHCAVLSCLAYWSGGRSIPQPRNTQGAVSMLGILNRR